MANNFKLDYTGEEVNSILEKADKFKQLTVDSSLSTSSTNPVQNKIITSSLNNKLNSSAIENNISTTSTNPVQNKVITGFLNTIDRYSEPTITDGSPVQLSLSMPMTSSGYTKGKIVKLSAKNLPAVMSWENIVHDFTISKLNSIIEGNGIYVAVGTDGAIISSTNGINWTLQNSGITTDLNDIAFVYNKFIAVGVAGVILTSEDAITWTLQNSGTDKVLTEILYANDTLYVCGEATQLLTSIDTINWNFLENKLPTAENNGYYCCFVHCDNRFYISNTSTSPGWGFTNYYGLLYMSYDLVSWTRVNFHNGGLLNYKVVYFNNKYFAFGKNAKNSMVSEDGITWQSHSTGINKTIYDVLIADNKLLLSCQQGYYISTDGITFTYISTTVDNNCTIYHNKQYISVGKSSAKVNIATCKQMDFVKYNYPTLNINSLGAKTINGTIEYGKNYTLIYNGVNWDIEAENAVFKKQEIVYGETLFNYQKHFTCFMIGLLKNNTDLKIVMPNSEITLYTQEEGKDIKVITTDTTISVINHTDNTENIIYRIIE